MHQPDIEQRQRDGRELDQQEGIADVIAGLDAQHGNAAGSGDGLRRDGIGGTVGIQAQSRAAEYFTGGDSRFGYAGVKAREEVWRAGVYDAGYR